MKHTPWCLLFAFLSQCVVPSPRPQTDAASNEQDGAETSAPTDAQSTTDAEAPDAPPDANDAATTTDAPRGTPIEAPMERWTWVPIDGMRCGNGSPTGVAVNLTQRSNQLVVIFQGGGACWDISTCYILRSASSIDGYSMNSFEADRTGLERSVLLNRSNAETPFRDANFVFVPYCTGDLHIGSRIVRYEALGQTRDMHYVGSQNIDALLPRLKATFPNASRVWLYGMSAGGYGVVMNWHRFARALAPSRVDALSDCGVPVSPPDGRYATWHSTWNAQTPANCMDCNRNMTSVLTTQLQAMNGTRYAQLAYTNDAVLSTFYGVAQPAFAPLVQGLHNTLATQTSARTFILSGNSHVMAGTVQTLRARDNTLLLDWIRQWATDSPAWSNHTPY